MINSDSIHNTLTLAVDLNALLSPHFQSQTSTLGWRFNDQVEFFLEELEEALSDYGFSVAACEFILTANTNNHPKKTVILKQSPLHSKEYPLDFLEKNVRQALQQIAPEEYPLLSRLRDLPLCVLEDLSQAYGQKAMLLLTSSAENADFFEKHTQGKAVRFSVEHELVATQVEQVRKAMLNKPCWAVELHYDIDDSILPLNALPQAINTPLNPHVLAFHRDVKRLANIIPTSLSAHICTARSHWLQGLQTWLTKTCEPSFPKHTDSTQTEEVLEKFHSLCQGIQSYSRTALTAELENFYSEWQKVLKTVATDVISLNAEIMFIESLKQKIHLHLEHQFNKHTTPAVHQAFVAEIQDRIPPEHIIHTEGQQEAKAVAILSAAAHRQRLAGPAREGTIVVLIDNSRSELAAFNSQAGAFEEKGLLSIPVRVLEPGHYSPECVLDVVDYCEAIFTAELQQNTSPITKSPTPERLSDEENQPVRVDQSAYTACNLFATTQEKSPASHSTTSTLNPN
jgi:hypothetical protein